MPFVVALFNIIVIGFMHLINANKKTLYQPIRLITYDFIVASVSSISALGLGLLITTLTELTDLSALFLSSSLAMFFNLFYIVKMRDNIWFSIINEEIIKIEETAIKVTTLPKLFSYLIPSVNSDIAIYVASIGIIVEKDFYTNSSAVFKKYISHLAIAFKKSAISTRLFSHLFISQVGFLLLLLMYEWIKANVRVDAYLANGFTSEELLMLAVFFASLVATVYSFAMVLSLIKWQWTFVEQDMHERFTAAEIHQIKSELALYQPKVAGYYNLFKWLAYKPQLS